MTTPVLRPLGPYEQYSSSRHALGLYVNVVTVCRYELPAGTDTASLQASLTDALADVVAERLPALRVGIAGEDTRQPVFVAVPRIDVREHMACEARPPDATPSEADTLLAADLARENAHAWTDVARVPPWRVVVYACTAQRWADVAFSVHHALADGKSGGVFHVHLQSALAALTALTTGTTRDPVVARPGRPVLAPTQEQLVPWSSTPGYLARTIWARLGPAWLKAPPPIETPCFTGPRVRLHAHVLDGERRLFHLSPDQSTTLVHGCRAHGTTLTALLQGLMMVLLARRVPVADTPSDTARSPRQGFTCGMPVSTRPFVPVEYVEHDVEHNLGNFVCGHHYEFTSDVVAKTILDDDDDVVWRAATAVGADLKARLADLTRNNVAGLMAWIGDWHGYWRKQDGAVREYTWTVSNTGVLDANQGDPVDSADPAWRIVRTLYAQSSMGKDALVSVNVGSVRGGDMSFVVNWHRGVVADAFGDAVAHDLQACLVRFCTDGHFAVPSS